MAVDIQIRNLTGIAMKIAEQPEADPGLKASMPPACTYVTDASTMLIKSTGELLVDSVSGGGRQDLLDSVRGILEGTTRILTVFDDSEMYELKDGLT
jgi:hypothetical protein